MFIRRLNPVPKSTNFTPSVALQRCLQFRGRKLRKSKTYQLLERLEAARVQADSLKPGDPARHHWLLPFRKDLHGLVDGFDQRCNNGELLVVRCYLLTCPRS